MNEIPVPESLKFPMVNQQRSEPARSVLNTGEYKRLDNGEIRRVVPKGTPPVDWRERCIKAEKFFIGLVEERKKIQDLILECCRKMDEAKFECEAGPLINFDPYMQLKAFARGVPHITRPPLDQMPLDGSRVIKRLIKHEKGTDLFLECGHEMNMLPGEYEAFAKDKLIVDTKVIQCQECTANLKERGMYESGTKPETPQPDA